MYVGQQDDIDPVGLCLSLAFLYIWVRRSKSEVDNEMDIEGNFR